MSCAREGANIWYLIRWPWGRRKLLTWGFWKGEYVWHDSFGRYWNQVFTCRLFGHQALALLDPETVDERVHCFKCERRVPGPYVGPISKLALRKFKQRKRD